MTTIQLPPLPCVGDLAFMTPQELRARDLEVARLVLEAAAKHIVELPCECCWPEGSDSVAEDFAAAIRNLEVKHHE